jgi:hypothetical protein
VVGHCCTASWSSNSYSTVDRVITESPWPCNECNLCLTQGLSVKGDTFNHSIPGDKQGGDNRKLVLVANAEAENHVGRLAVAYGCTVSRTVSRRPQCEWRVCRTGIVLNDSRSESQCWEVGIRGDRINLAFNSIGPSLCQANSMTVRTEVYRDVKLRLNWMFVGCLFVFDLSLNSLLPCRPARCLYRY